MSSHKPILVLEALTPETQGRTSADQRAKNMLLPLKKHMQSLGLSPAFAYAEHFAGLDLPNVLNHYSGVVIPGGTDIDPELYGGTREKGHKYFTDADEVQIAVVNAALALSMPVFGICRGFQILNVATNGTLHVEINGLSSTAAHNSYGGRSWPPRHEVQVLAKSDWLVQPDRLNIVSLHHQGIDTLGDDLTVVAVEENPDLFKLPEAVEHSNGNVVAVQWHPEHRADRTPWVLESLLQVFEPAKKVHGRPRNYVLQVEPTPRKHMFHEPMWKDEDLMWKSPSFGLLGSEDADLERDSLSFRTSTPQLDLGPMFTV